VQLHNSRGHSASMERIASMRCQSLANKHASRALVNYLLPDLELCTAGRKDSKPSLKVAKSRSKSFPTKSKVDGKLPSVAYNANSSGDSSEGMVGGMGAASCGVSSEDQSLDPTLSRHADGGWRKPISMAVSNPPPGTVAVIRRGGIEYIPLNPEADTSERSHDQLNHLGSCFLENSIMMSWTCFYFYASGTEKDRYEMNFKLSPDGRITGSGADSLGEFFVEGESDTAFFVTSFAFSKTYTNRGANRPRGGHVAHICHFSAGSILGPLSSGLWGVWETVTSSPHFELLKGGVFRMIPSHYIEELSCAVEPWDARE